MLNKDVLRTALVFALIIIAILLLFRLSAYTLLSRSLSTEFVLAAVAIVFFLIGLYVNRRAQQKEVRNDPEADTAKIEELGLSKREYEVLKEIDKGLSNKQIADRLFVSESTVKTHVSNVLLKLDAKRRTQAIRVAKQMGIL